MGVLLKEEGLGAYKIGKRTAARQNGNMMCLVARRMGAIELSYKEIDFGENARRKEAAQIPQHSFEQ